MNHFSDKSGVTKGGVIEVFTVFLKLGLTSFGGPIAHLGYFQKELIERRGWLSEQKFAELLAICQFLPGPASSQLGFSLGLVRAGWLGAVAAFVAFTLPSALALMVFAALLPNMSGPLSEAVIHGLKIVAFAVVADAVVAMSKKLCPDGARKIIAVSAFSALLCLNSAWLSFLVVGAGAMAGLLLFRFANAMSSSNSSHVSDQAFELRYGVRLASALLLLFAALLLGLPIWSSSDAGLLSVANVFYQAGALVFGGGHVLLPLLEESVVAPGWVSNEAFLAGYGASQAIPGPMFAFSAYLGGLIPMGHDGWLGALVALLFMFLPGFLLVGAVLPFWRAMSSSAAVMNAMAGVNAAVVGLLAAAFYDPIFASAILGVADLLIGLVGFALLHVWRWSALAVVAWCILASMASFYVTPAWL